MQSLDDSQSELTVYTQAVGKKRSGSSSSDINLSSDEHCESFESTEKELTQPKKKAKMIEPSQVDREQASISAGPVLEKDKEHKSPTQPTPRELADLIGEHMIKEAEASKGRAYDVSGMNSFDSIEKGIVQLRTVCAMRESVDDKYLLVASHIDQLTREKDH